MNTGLVLKGWWRVWINREKFRAFERRLEKAMAEDATLRVLREARRRRILEIIVEVGKES